MEWSSLSRKLKGSLAKIGLASAFVLVSALSYEAGSIRQALAEPAPVVIEVPGRMPEPAVPVRQGGSLPSNNGMPAETISTVGQGCAFVGSKNSNKYHIPASRCARQIKVENRVCFATVDAALAKGYVAGCLE
jgi:hypothetical protein